MNLKGIKKMTTKEKLEEITVVIKAIGLTPKLQYTENQTAQMLGISTAIIPQEI